MTSKDESGIILRHDESMLKTEVTEEELEFRNSLTIDNDKFKSEKIHCTACNKNLKDEIFTKLVFYVHPCLQVPICKGCFKFYSTGAFTPDDDGTDQYCRWCGQGGVLICCSRCSIVICIKCIKLNFPKEYCKETEKDDWLCFVCDTKPIWPIRALAATALQYIEDRRRKQMKRRESDEDKMAKPKKSRRNESDEDKEAKPKKSLRNESDEDEEAKPSRLRRSRKKDEATSSKRSRRDRSSENEFPEVKRSFRSRKMVLEEDNDSVSTEKKTKQRKPSIYYTDSNSNDSDDSSSSRLRKSKEASTTKSARKASRFREEKIENESPSKNELSTLLLHSLTDSVKDYSKLIKVMSKSQKDYVREYLQNKKLWTGDDGKQKSIDQYQELLAKTRDSIDKLERSFLTSMKNLNLSPTKAKDETEPLKEVEPMSVDEEGEKAEKNKVRIAGDENAEHGQDAEKEITESENDEQVIDKTKEDEETRVMESMEEDEEKEHRLSVDSTKIIDEEACIELTGEINLETAHENAEENIKTDKTETENEKESESSKLSFSNAFDEDARKSLLESKSEASEKSHLDDDDSPNLSKKNNDKMSEKDNENESVAKNDVDKEETKMIDNEDDDVSQTDSVSMNSLNSTSLLVHIDSFDEENTSETFNGGSKQTLEDSIVPSDTEKIKDKMTDSEKEIVAKAALLHSPSDPLETSSTEENEDDTVESSGKEKTAKAALLGSSDADTENADGLESSDSVISDVRKLDEDKNQQSRKKRSKKLESSKIKKENMGNDDDKEIDRLTRLDNLGLRRRKRSESDDENDASTDSEKENRMNTTDNSKKRLSLRKKKMKKRLADFISDESSNGDKSSDDVGELSFDNFNSFLEQKEKEHTMDKDQLSKKLLLMDSDSDVHRDSNDSDSDVGNLINKSIEKNKKQKNGSSTNNMREEHNDTDDPVTFKTKPKKKTASWRNDRLLTSKLSDPATSDDERAISKARSRERIEKEKRAAKRAAKGSESSDSEDIFRPKTTSQKIKKRKVNFSSSDSEASVKILSNSSSVEILSDHETKKNKRPKKRKRVIGAWERSDSDNDDKNTSQTGSATKGRKNIRKILDEKDLGEMTRKTAKAEEDRKKRLAEKQVLFEQSFKMPDDANDHLDKLVLDFDPETKEEIISIHPKLLRKLKPHQAKGVKFMWDSCFESIKQIEKSQGGGCILAHCMGLGKTLQVITLVHTVLRYSQLTKIERVLIICPLSTVLNWVHEFEHWLKNIDDNDFDVDHLNKHKNNAVRADYLRRWFREGGVMILGYDMFRNLVNNKKLKTSLKKNIDEALLDPGPDLVICDEGHVLKNESSGVSLATTQIKTLRRIVLTGTPLQNNLAEYHCMVQFVKPNLLGTRKEFLNRFVNPITNGQYTNSTEKDVKVMKRRAHVLHKMLDGIVQRFDYKVLMPFLPPKHEFVISVALSDLQAKLYEHYIKTLSRMANCTTSLFKDYQVMRLIWTHPYAMKLSAERAAKVKQVEDDVDSLKDFVVSGSDDESSTHSDNSIVSISDEKSDVKTRSSNKKNGKDEEEEALDPENNVMSTWWSEFVSSEDIEDYKQGPKLVLLFAILRECENRGDKVLIFSQSIPSLDMIECFLDRSEELSQYAPFLERENFNHIGNWKKNADYFRLDGSTPNDLRARYCNAFNKVSNKRARLFLISTKAGGLGINLTAANRVIIFDASWNPSHDVQSIFRVFRFGQSKPCYIYRFLSQGTMEEKIYERQVTKLSVSCRVVDEQQIDRHFSRNEIEELYTFNRKIPDENETPKLPNDDLMAELLKQYKKYIISYHEHDSLLENIVDEELTEEERKQAWEEYENDKKPRLLPVMPPKIGGITDEDIIAAVIKEHPNASADMLKIYAAQVRMKLMLAQQPAMQYQQPMQMNNFQFARQHELANMQKAAYRYQLQQQLLNQRKENQPVVVNQAIPDTAFEVLQKAGFTTPKKMPPSSSGFSPQLYGSPLKRNNKASPLTTPTKYNDDGSDFEEDTYNIETEFHPLKTPQTWAFKWLSTTNPSRLMNVLKANCQWLAKYEQIGECTLMHLPYCVRRQTLEKKLADYISYIQFNRITPYVSDQDLFDIIVKTVVQPSGTTNA